MRHRACLVAGIVAVGARFQLFVLLNQESMFYILGVTLPYMWTPWDQYDTHPTDLFLPSVPTQSSRWG